MEPSKPANRLINETSPYLLQHAHNPVDWYPWGEEALTKAQNEEKPIFLSIGYSACHWCHVMERECFENQAIAEVMNEHFINIKVDREERPDLDEIYMNAVQSLTGAGGWPMSVFLTPEGKPFYGGTYFPPRDMYGRPGFPTVLQSIAKAYEERREDINESANQLTDHVRDMVNLRGGEGELDDRFIQSAFEDLKRRYDSKHGGFGSAPKFPHSMDISLLLRYYKKKGEKTALDMSLHSLKKMSQGGMYDQLGGGFHRYSTDAEWLIPHFEKMLYDNALLAKTYTEAYQLTKDPYYKKIVKETLDYVEREMTSPEGGFYSTQDADSEGIEGAFFVWTTDEIHEVLGEEKGNLVCQYYGVEPMGNFEHRHNVLHMAADLDQLAKQTGISQDELTNTIKEANCKLFAVREKRVKPKRDEKILSDWNGLMISSLAYAGNVFREEKYITMARNAAEFIFTHLKQQDRLYHTYKDGRVHTNGFLSDYSYLSNALLDLYEATMNPRWLREANQLTQSMITHFWDHEKGAFFFTSDDHEPLIARTKDPMDNAVPSGNSIAVQALLRLKEMTGELSYQEKAETCFHAFEEPLRRIPSAFTQMLCALDFMLSSPKEIVLAGETPKSLENFQEAIFTEFIPDKVVLYCEQSTKEELRSLTTIVEGKEPQNGNSLAYVCQNFTCKQPVSKTEELVQQLLP